MENKIIARTLRLLGQLMELHDENPFKVKSIANAAFKIDKLPYPIAGKSLTEMEQIDGLGKSTASKVWALVQTNSIPELSDLLAQTPSGIVEMMRIKGLGPKKIVVIWKELEIENVGELYYACNENRLIEAKGFGLKTQEEIKKAIEFSMASSGRFIYARIEHFAEGLLQELQRQFRTDQVYVVGQYRRRCEIIDSLDILTSYSLTNDIKQLLENAGLNPGSFINNAIECEAEIGIKVNLIFCTSENIGWQKILHTGNNDHVDELALKLVNTDVSGKSEYEIYALAGIPFIEPELREGLNEFPLAAANKLPDLISYTDLKGTLHNHSTWSDGVHSLEEMAVFCRDELKLAYLGICDHSKSAFYANGLNEIRVAAQQREIEELNIKLAPFYIFKGIESDILYDGSLDYSSDVLASFDFVVASVHSILKMTEDKATERLIKAVENPFTTILGHPTGRLLLSRGGYPINHRKVIDACAANNVIIEINANPLRLDLDWRWQQYAIEKGVLLSINPDAHRKEGFYDMHYGTLIARKGGVSRNNCLNAMDLDQIKTLFTKKRS
ncbi:DNA polymerase/3'-5' exonuclease PolX [Daejeonella lutea]|uniref:DNA polymerase (Family 10) n=1 Tax=Daejeonella lutea TaxID=572036 RepID=A0A1T5AUN2_9SPHI|nr:DNA polymerase/3'-5' exonuclease PolX [Daejeonella lutea]SKB38771.1 DNA polymerase (family 10) [Daejeonella lutea]